MPSSQGKEQSRGQVPSTRAKSLRCVLLPQWMQSSALHSLSATAAGHPSQTRTLKARHTLSPSTMSQECGCDLAQATRSGLLGHCVQETGHGCCHVRVQCGQGYCSGSSHGQGIESYPSFPWDSTQGCLVPQGWHPQGKDRRDPEEESTAKSEATVIRDLSLSHGSAAC